MTYYILFYNNAGLFNIMIWNLNLNMPLLLSSILANSPQSHQPFVLLQSSTAQTCLPILRRIINHKIAANRVHTLLICLLHIPSSLVQAPFQDDTIEVLDYTDKIPGYHDSWADPREDILNMVNASEYAEYLWHPWSISTVQQLRQDL